MISAFQNQRILVTGAGGYIGSHLVDALSKINCHIVRMSKKQLSQKINCAATVEDIQTDLRDVTNWDALLDSIDFIFHLAAQTGAKTADDFPVDDMEINIIPFLKILNAAKKSGNKKILLAGSATQYGLQEKLPVNEKAIDSSVTLYDLNKSVAENYLRYFVNNNWVRGTCLRLSNVYGPGVQSSNKSRGVLNQVIYNALNGKEIVIFGGGKFIRDYIYITDVVNAFLHAGAFIDSLTQSHYVIGTGVGTTLKETFMLAAKCVTEKSGCAVTITDRDLPPNFSPIDCRNFIADSQAFSKKTRWHPNYALKEGVYETIAAYQRNRAHDCQCK